MDNYTQAGFVTHDLEGAIAHWYGLGAGPFFIVDLDPLFADPVKCPRTYRGSPARDEFRIAVGFFGTTQIEMIQPTNDEPSVFREHLDRSGEVLHHIQPKAAVVSAELFDEAAANYERMGLELVATIVQPNGKRVAFYDGVSRFGFFLEIVEKGPKAFEGAIEMHRLHLEREKHPMIMV